MRFAIKHPSRQTPRLFVHEPRFQIMGSEGSRACEALLLPILTIVLGAERYKKGLGIRAG